MGLKTGRVRSLASRANGAGMRGGTLQVSICVTLMSCCWYFTGLSQTTAHLACSPAKYLAECLKGVAEPVSPAAGAPKPLEPHLLTLSMLPRAQWQNLVHLDAIKVSAGCLCTDVDSGGVAVCWAGPHAARNCSGGGLCGAAMRLQLVVWLGC